MRDSGPTLRVLRHPLGSWVEPAAAFASHFASETDVVWLDSGGQGKPGRSYLGRGSAIVTSATVDGSVLDYLRADLAKRPVPDARGAFALGWVGWLGYELRFETMAESRTRESRYPDAAFMFVDRAIEFDHLSGEVTLLALGAEWDDELVEWRESTLAALATAPTPPDRTVPVQRQAQWRYSDEQYLSMIEACQERIVNGDAYQLCLTSEASVDGAVDPATTYLALRESSPSHHGALLRIGEIALLSSSPERFLSVSPRGVVESRPIKGTRRRGATAESDAELRLDLESSDKERAENLMIVDLMRNDISRVSSLGSVEVTRLLHVESYAHVHQLVSTVQGELAEGLDGIDAVVACFPAGSMTGAPKRSATRILDALEDRPRGIYSGAFGYFGLDGRIDLAMVIRTIIIDPDGATVGSGGGITALSDPTAELEEVRLKAAALLRVLGAADTAD